jgi:hypothetical protein
MKVNYAVKSREVIAIVEGVTYRIPDMWIVGATHGGRTIREALALWHEQAQLEQAHAEGK